MDCVIGVEAERLVLGLVRMPTINGHFSLCQVLFFFELRNIPAMLLRSTETASSCEYTYINKLELIIVGIIADTCLLSKEQKHVACSHRFQEKVPK